MLSQEFRRSFLEYFKSKGHALLPSSSVVPHEDPTLLFTNAGMNQFKDVFTGESKRDYVSATTSQKCIRVGGKHNDLDNVGHTSRHLTFFEMLGNFSFGDYFKKEAIAYAFEVTTQIFQFDPDLLWITIYEDDDEAFELWTKWVRPERIVRMGEADNFWAMGDTGPCGPCSELHYDRGKAYGDATSPKDDASGERYIEFWNLVFMQYNRDSSGKQTPLKNKGVDTGAGLERLLALKLGTDSLFETDILRSLIAKTEELSGSVYDPSNKKTAPAFHVIADHLRSLSFAIADGAQPSNIERGYVLRKLLRRAVRYGRQLGFTGPFLSELLPILVSSMGDDFPELKDSQKRIEELLVAEEESFLRTLKRGGNILSSIITKALDNPYKQISGEDAFKLKDTYGFPLEEVLLLAKDSNLTVNLETYELLEQQAKKRSRSAQDIEAKTVDTTIYKEFLSVHGPSEFIGYTDEKCEASVMAILVDNKFVDKMETGQEGTIFLNHTPFYAEKGGQIYDIGELLHKSAHFTVTDVQSPYPGVIAHHGVLDHGTMIVSEPVTAKIDHPRRQRIANHHTATHLLHWALQQVLGAHIRQSGSLVEPHRLRFDFTHHKSLSPQEIHDIENLINDKIRENTSVETCVISYEEATAKPEIKQFFGDKYGSQVRLVDIDYSKELCGGTHTSHLGTIGLFRITKESSIAAGIRRIEAATGKDAEEYMYSREQLLSTLGTICKTTPEKLPDHLAHLNTEHKQLLSQLKSLKKASLNAIAASLTPTLINDIPLITHLLSPEHEATDLQLLAENLLSQHPSLCIILGHASDHKAQLLVALSPDLISNKNLNAVTLIREIAPLIGGGGGGRPHLAQAGGKKPDGIQPAFTKAHDLLQQL